MLSCSTNHSYSQTVCSQSVSQRHKLGLHDSVSQNTSDISKEEEEKDLYISHSGGIYISFNQVKLRLAGVSE